MINPLLDLLMTKSIASSNPMPGKCTMWLPIWHPNLQHPSFRSIDLYGRKCTATNVTWGSSGAILNGTSSLIDCGDLGVAKSLILWIYPTTTTESILEEVDNTGVSVAAGTMSYPSWDKCYVNETETDTVSATMQMVTLTSSSNVDVSALRLGLVDASYLDGTIAEVWLYEHELIEELVKFVYRQTRIRH